MNKILFSLILPVYNVENYIQRCMLSCLNQSFDYAHYEIIVVDDSSPDKSIDLVREISSDYPDAQVSIIKRPNGGLSAARNTGMQIAKGEWLWFIDSDDFISPFALNTLAHAVATTPNVNIINFGYKRVQLDETIDFNVIPTVESRIISPEEFLGNNYFLSAWSRLYNREFVIGNRLYFREGILWEDSHYNLRAIPMAKNMLTLDTPLYYYVNRPGSISTGRHILATQRSRLIILEDIIKWVKDSGLDNELKKIIALHLAKTILCFIGGQQELIKKDRQELYKQFFLTKGCIKWVKKEIDSPLYLYLLTISLVSPKLLQWPLYSRLRIAMARSDKHKA
ncbi:MAG: glycosyltransferase [Bacteroidales bacterium]|nr:glycosyltransferase [Bacteroidales bacterium]